MNATRCRGCGAQLDTTFADLGTAPLSNAYLEAGDLERAERYFPLHARICRRCFLVQVGVYESPEAIFSQYAYFSSYSEAWLEHARRFAEAAIGRLQLTAQNLVCEVASNDGYLLQFFVERGIGVLGVEPAANVAQVAREKGIRTEVRFFGKASARELRERYGPADLLVANNVIAHVPDLHDFVAGFAVMLAEDGLASVEFPHLLNLIEQTQFDTIYHEHFSYLSLLSLEPVLAAHGLRVVDVERIATHGGSLRVWIALAASRVAVAPCVEEVRTLERVGGLDDLQTYAGFAPAVLRVKRGFLGFLLEAQARGELVAAYGAAAKGNTLLNYCGVKADLVAFVADRNPHKQGRYMPGSRIPIVTPQTLLDARPRYVVILPWNLRDEVIEQLAAVRRWGGSFVVAVPELQVYP